jgi:CspA family cold shock protein
LVAARQKVPASLAQMASGGGDWRSGAIKWFDQRNGFSFIVNDQGGDDVYVNEEALLLADISEPYPGQPVRFRCRRGSKGWRAVELKACEAGNVGARGESAGPPPSGSASRQSGHTAGR